MEKSKSQDKYTEITREIREEKMNWSFEEFLEKANEEEKVIPLKKVQKGGYFPKNFWMAASLILLFSVGVFFKFGNSNSVEDQNNLVKNEILKEKDNFQHESNFAVNAVNDSVEVRKDSIISDSSRTVEQSPEVDIMEKILPRRGRIRKDVRPRFAAVSSEMSDHKKNTEKPEYESNYVIINGQKIENEQEAIDLTKYSFRILSENVLKTVAQTDVITAINEEY
ncbi:hypothetical protein SAMN05421638_1838 [Kaistella treverensis]|uniref:Uncharacterized protein n=1 Tax=Kaistella treverensis TaxID=631455 RepID=A0A1I3MXA9_9FLAO|nr:hypothetical protein [Kaistella treverensis]SFJ01395.1 hypothetical protein SAMN05421638_1838 [Kaistella treverensis]